MIHEQHCFVCSYSYRICLNDQRQDPISQSHFGMTPPRASHPGRLSSWVKITESAVRQSAVILVMAC
jgi:hypothetical protein